MSQEIVPIQMDSPFISKVLHAPRHVYAGILGQGSTIIVVAHVWATSNPIIISLETKSITLPIRVSEEKTVGRLSNERIHYWNFGVPCFSVNRGNRQRQYLFESKFLLFGEAHDAPASNEEVVICQIRKADPNTLIATPWDTIDPAKSDAARTFVHHVRSIWEHIR